MRGLCWVGFFCCWDPHELCSCSAGGGVDKEVVVEERTQGQTLKVADGILRTG